MFNNNNNQRYLLLVEQTLKSHSNFSIIGPKMFLNDASSLHRCYGQVSHHHSFMELPHHDKRISRKFQYVTIVGKYFLYHSTDVTVQGFCQFRRSAFSGFSVFLSEVCKTFIRNIFTLLTAWLLIQILYSCVSANFFLFRMESSSCYTWYVTKH